MIYKEGKDISGFYFAGKVIVAVYDWIYLVWQAVRSCYGSGAWLDHLPWLDDDPWKD
jgi:hypothetical protein